MPNSSYVADSVVALRDDDSRAVSCVVTEVQLRRDPDKEWSWPVYLTHVRARLRCKAVLLVVAPDPEVAAWAGKAIDCGHPGMVLAPLVVGADQIPVVTDREAAGEDPELAVLSCMAHGHSEQGYEVTFAALHATGVIDEERKKRYNAVILAAASEAVRKRLEEDMDLGNYPEPTELEKRILARGFEDGRTAGLLDAAAQHVLSVLTARGLSATGAQRETILACRDLDRLERWHTQAVTAVAVDDLFHSFDAE